MHACFRDPGFWILFGNQPLHLPTIGRDLEENLPSFINFSLFVTFTHFYGP